MARLDNNPYPSIHYDELKKPFTIVIDMINGFVKEGALADPAIALAAEPIQKLLEVSNRILFVTDAHEPDAAEFESFPVHCLKGTEESRVMDELLPYTEKTNSSILEKNAINTFSAPGFDKILQSIEDYTDVILCGCCTDLCVLQLALSLQSWIHQNNRKIRVFIAADTVDTYEIPNVHEAAFWNHAALENMKACGINIVSSIQAD